MNKQSGAHIKGKQVGGSHKYESRGMRVREVEIRQEKCKKKKNCLIRFNKVLEKDCVFVQIFTKTCMKWPTNNPIL